jgi:cyclin-dependent kinase 12/13
MRAGVFPELRESEPFPSDTVDICRDGITGFRKLHKIGFGTYGSIYLAIHKMEPRSLFALKKFKFPDDKVEYGLPRSAVREIRILKELVHENIVDCRGVLVSSGNDLNKNKGSIYMVLGFVEHDLVGILELWKRKLTIPEIKSISIQVLRAIDFCHIRGIVHRDLKCANILVSRTGQVKLADFGLAREYARDPLMERTDQMDTPKEPMHMTNKVITLWYRPPELLLGATTYGSEIDIWSMGAILAELLLQRPLFGADKEIGVFGMIVHELGSPVHTHAAVEYLKTLPYWKDFHAAVLGTNNDRFCKIDATLCQHVSNSSWDLIGQMLNYSPGARISAAAAIEHEFFSEAPEACHPSAIRVPQDDFCHGMSMKQKRERSEKDFDHSAKKSRPM